MLKLAVVGKDVSKSLSPDMHGFLLSNMGETCSYDKVSIAPSEFVGRAEELFEKYDGFNVTIPFKAEILPFLKTVEKNAAKLCAVNTVTVKDRAGYNTDGLGFSLMLQLSGICVTGKRVLVLGAGGAGRVCIQTLHSEGATVFAYERNYDRLLETSQSLGGFTPLKTLPERGYDIIVNCTGIGMHDTVGKTPSVRFDGGEEKPIGSEFFAATEAAVDLIYEPEESEFLRLAKSVGCKTQNGDPMLFYQAYYADCLYLQRKADKDEAVALYRAYKSRRTV